MMSYYLAKEAHNQPAILTKVVLSSLDLAVETHWKPRSE